jgi:large subunit ribosomal protein L19
MNALEKIEQQQMKKDGPTFRSGDTLRVHVKIKEGEKERIQVFEGTVSLRRAQNHSSFTVRKISFGQGGAHLPALARDRQNRSRRSSACAAPLYYLRKLRQGRTPAQVRTGARS